MEKDNNPIPNLTTKINRGGRTRGTPNKISIEVRRFFIELLDENKDQIRNDLANLKPQQRLNIIIKLLPFILPKMTSISFDTSEEQQNHAIGLLNKLFDYND